MSTSLSYVSYTGDGATTQFDLTFSYLRQEHVFVFVDSSLAAFSWVSGTRVSLSPAPPEGSTVTVRRLTDRVNRITTFADGTTLLSKDLNAADLQTFYILQEIADNIADQVLVGAIPINEAGSGYITEQWIAAQVTASVAGSQALSELNDAIVAEAQTRAQETADNALAIADETAARIAAVSAEAQDRAAAILVETNARAQAIIDEAAARQGADDAAALRLDALEASVGNPNSDLAARVTSAEAAIVDLENDKAEAVDLDTVEAQINTPTTGILARTSELEVTTADLQSNKADATALAATEALITAPTTGLNARTAELETSTADLEANKAEASELAIVESQINTPTTGILARTTSLEGRTTAVEGEQSTQGTRIDSLETTIDTPTTGLSAKVSGLETTTASLETNKAEASDVDLVMAQAQQVAGVAGSNMVTNGGFDSNINGWVGARGNETLSLIVDRLRITGTIGGEFGASYLVQGLEVGADYTFSAAVGLGTLQSSFRMRVDTVASLSDATGQVIPTVNGQTDMTFTATAEDMYVGFVLSSLSNGEWGEAKNISVTKVNSLSSQALSLESRLTTVESGKADASALSLVSARVDAEEATSVLLMDAFADSSGDVIASINLVAAASGGDPAEIEIVSAADGSGVRIVGNTQIAGDLLVNGSILAEKIGIGTLDASLFSANFGLFEDYISVGNSADGSDRTYIAGNNYSTTHRIWVGASDPASAPFSVSKTGGVDASDLNIYNDQGTLIFGSTVGFTDFGRQQVLLGTGQSTNPLTLETTTNTEASDVVSLTEDTTLEYRVIVPQFTKTKTWYDVAQTYDPPPSESPIPTSFIVTIQKSFNSGAYATVGSFTLVEGTHYQVNRTLNPPIFNPLNSTYNRSAFYSVVGLGAFRAGLNDIAIPAPGQSSSLSEAFTNTGGVDTVTYRLDISSSLIDDITRTLEVRDVFPATGFVVGDTGATGGADVVNADTLGGNAPTHYLDYNNLVNTPSFDYNNLVNTPDFSQITEDYVFAPTRHIRWENSTGVKLDFGYTTTYTMGIQASTLYFRSASRFAFHVGGTHNDGVVDPGGGTLVLEVNSTNFQYKGNEVATQAWVLAQGYSDMKLKQNVQPLQSPLDLVEWMYPVRYDRIDTERHEVGFVAQELQSVLPEVVRDLDGTLAVDYGKITAVAIGAIKELKQQVEDLRFELELLKQNP